MASSAFATDPTGITATNGVAQPATCDTGTLGTSTGSAQLRANFTPEVITLRWYNNNTLLDVTSTSSNTCTYDNAISLPTNPTKTGYTFKGWKIKPEYDFSTLDVSQLVDAYAKGSYTCFKPWEDMTCDSQFSDLNIGEWKKVFNHGSLYGMASCSTSNTNAPDEINFGIYCWCKVTGYKPNNSDTLYRPSPTLQWIFSQNYQTEGGCTSRCAFSCSSMFYGAYARYLLFPES